MHSYLTILKNALLNQGVSSERIRICTDECEAAELSLGKIQEGDVLLLLSHTHYDDVVQLLKTTSSV